MNNFFDFIVIGAGISACTFASFLNKRFSDASILLIEQGRRLGGRSTTRKSRKNTILEFDHGLPSINFSKNMSAELKAFILPFIHSKKLVDISNEIFMINEFGDIDNVLTTDKIYRSLPFMINFCEEIINQSINPKKINFLFQSITKSIKRINDLWEVKYDNERLIKSKSLILSSSLIAHPRCLNILKINSLPLRDAFIPGEDEVVDSLLSQVCKQKYLQRRVYILYAAKSDMPKNFNHKYIQICFSKIIRENLNFERIIFQKQSDGSIVILLHCFYINRIFKIDSDKIIISLISIFRKKKEYIDLFLKSRLIDKMDWRSSQPLNHLLSKDLQWSSISNIGFCGDWFDLKNSTGVEAAMNSSIRLAKLLSWK